MKKILIIDDENSLRETISELFMVSGFTVFEAQNGEEGLQIVQEKNPDLIICDVMMPVLDGYGFMEKHSNSAFSHIPVLLLTAKVEVKDTEKGINLGAKAYIKKPFVFSELKKLVDSYII
jgi:two-component system, chemotaxis family, chemotaxis protein CheY